MNNQLNLIGRITKDLELRNTTSGKAVLEIPLAISNGKDDTTFISVTAFNSSAELTYKYCKKGDLLGVSAMVKNNNYEDEKGKHYGFRFLVKNVLFLQSKKEEVKLPQNIKSNYQENEEITLSDEDLPF